MLNLSETLIRSLIKELIKETLETRSQYLTRTGAGKNLQSTVGNLNSPTYRLSDLSNRFQQFNQKQQPKSDFDNFKLIFDNWWKTQDQNNFESASQIYTSFINDNREKLEIEKINSIRSEVRNYISSKLPHDKRQNLHEKNRKYFIRRSRS